MLKINNVFMQSDICFFYIHSKMLFIYLFTSPCVQFWNIIKDSIFISIL